MMGVLKILGLSILYFVGIVIFATVLALGTLFTYFPLQMYLFGRGDYLLFVSSKFNMIPALMIMLLIVYAFIRLKERFFGNKETFKEIIEDTEETKDIEIFSNKEQFIFKVLNRLEAFDDKAIKVFNVIKICYIPVLIMVIYCGMTSYTILYNDGIKVSSPIAPTRVFYKYSDIKSIQVGVDRERRNSYSAYYSVIFNDGKSVNFFEGSMHEDKDKGFEYILIDLDKKLRAQGVSKSVSKVNFEEYSKGLDKEFVSRVEKLFDDK